MKRLESMFIVSLLIAAFIIAHPRTQWIITHNESIISQIPQVFQGKIIDHSTENMLLKVSDELENATLSGSNAYDCAGQISLQDLVHRSTSENDDRNRFTYVDDDSAHFVIGLSNIDPETSSELVNCIAEYRGIIIDKIFLNKKLNALVVDAPFEAVSTLKSEIADAGLLDYFEPSRKFTADLVPNDPNWIDQWGPKKIEADWAWNTTTGNSLILVAVLDTGIDWDHPDLTANYVPLGYDWINNDNDPMDDEGHGTHCTGIIAAILNNTVGIAGLAQVRVMAEKVLDSEGRGSDYSVSKGIIHATDAGADIISISLGSTEDSELVHTAIKYAYNHSVLIIAAAGNAASSSKHYPAFYKEVVAVTATDQVDGPASFTSFGRWVELAAPGVNIYSTLWNDRYASGSGTSMACPHTVGVAALIWSQFPNMSREWVRYQLRASSDDLGEPGFDSYFGYGRINARRAVELNLSDHELLISRCQRPRYVEPGQCGTILTHILNYGLNDESNITVQLLINGSIFYSTVISFLASGSEIAASLSWEPIIKGRYNVTSYVVPEADEAILENNVDIGFVDVEVPLKVAVIDSWGTSHVENWDRLNDEWRIFGNQLIDIDYETLAHDGITYGEIVSTDVDTLIISSANDYGWFFGDFTFTNLEIAAIRKYVLEGHGLIVTGLTLNTEYGPTHNELGPLFGLREEVTWDYSQTTELEIVNPTHPLFKNVSNPITFELTTSSKPLSKPWDSNVLEGGTYVALGPYRESAIVTYKGLVFISPFVECDQNFNHNYAQLFYNAITWSKFHTHDHELTVALDSPVVGHVENTYLLNATLFNIGQHNETNVELCIFVNNSLLGNKEISEIANGSSYRHSCEWTPNEGMYNITAYVSVVPNEDYTSNNILSIKTKCVKTRNRILWDISHRLWGPGHGSLSVTHGYLKQILSFQGDILDEVRYSPINQDMLFHYDVLALVDPQTDLHESEIKDIQSWIATGGALLVIPDYHVYSSLTEFNRSWCVGPSSNLNNLLAPFGVQVTGRFSHWSKTENITEHHIMQNVNSIYYEVSCELEVIEPSEILAWTAEPYPLISTTPGCEVIVLSDSHIFESYRLTLADNLQLLLNVFNWISGNYDHDLAVTLDVPSILNVDETYKISATVTNRGMNDETDVEMKLFRDGVVVNSSTVPQIQAGSSYRLTYLLGTMKEALFNITISSSITPDENVTCNNVLSANILARIPWHILVYSEFSLSYEYENVLEILELTFGEICVVSELRDHIELSSTLLGNDVFLILEQENANLSTMEMIGEIWSSTLSNFVTQGGIIVLCDYSKGFGGTYGILTGAGLMFIEGANEVISENIFLADPLSLLAGNIPSSFSIHQSALSFSTNETTIVFDDGVDPVGILKEVGRGKIALLGFDYFKWFTWGGNLGRVVTNWKPNVWATHILRNALGLQLGYEHEISVVLKAPDHIEPGNQNQIKVGVYNRGLTNETEVILHFLVNGSEVESFITALLPEGSKCAYLPMWTPQTEGIYNLTAFVIPRVGEIMSFNNADQMQIEVYFHPRISFNPPIIIRAIGQNFTLDIDVSHAREVSAWGIDLEWNSTLLSLMDVTEGSFLSEQGITFFNFVADYEDGYLHVDCALLLESFTLENGTLVSLTFLVETGGEDYLCPSNTILLTRSESVVLNITHNVSQGFFRSSVLGDIDGDGDVDIFDVVAACSAYGKVKNDFKFDSRVDMNNDGIIDISDITTIISCYSIKNPFT